MHQFRLKNKGTVFGYDNQFNSLYDKDGNMLSQPHNMPQGYIDFIRDRNMDSEKVIKKSEAPIMIKISMGQKCNYSCGYCSQTELGDNHPSRWGGLKREMEIAAIGNLIRDMNENLDLHRLQRLELWGGETLIYWEEIKMLMEAFDREELVWYIPTNGSLLTKEKIDFFKEAKGTVTFGISHDGYCHELTRGKDILKDPKMVETLKYLQAAEPKCQFSFNPVISKENFDLFKLDKFFKDWCVANEMKPVGLSMELITVYNLAEVRGDSQSWAIRDENLEKYKKILKEYLAAHAKQYQELGPHKVQYGELLMSSLAETGFGFLPYAKTLQKEDILHVGSNCQADQEGLLTIDTQGNVKTCQNVGEEFKYGHIKDMQAVGVKGLNTNKKARCQSCRVKFLCNSGCPIEQPDEVFDTNCALYKVHYGAIQDAAMEYLFQDEVVYEGLKDNEVEIQSS